MSNIPFFLPLTQKKIILSLQHIIAMFGATVLVPALTGLDYTVTLLAVGLATLLFHFISGKQVPIFLGSSFAFIGAIQLVMKQDGLAAVKFGIIAAGLVHILVAWLIKLFGKEAILKLLPAVVIGPVICVIGLRLSPVALHMSGYSVGTGSFDLTSLLIAAITVLTVILTSSFTVGFFKLVPILAGVIVGYLAAMILGVVDFSHIINAPWFGLSENSLATITTLPQINWFAFAAIAPVAIVTVVEHIGDVTANGKVVGKEFIKDPGLNITLLGDGLAASLSGFFGGPATTTYAENTGVLAVTKVYDPSILRLAALFTVIVSFVGKIGGLLQSIPVAVMGGISFILFGMISAIGLRTLSQAKLDFGHSRNLIICGVILVSGIAVDNVNFGSFAISGLSMSVILGILLNLILPKEG